MNIRVVTRGFLFYICPFLSSSTDSYIEVLDGSRVHPETYEWARKMAVDALEYDESAEDANPAGALEEILENPERLKDLDLDAFAEELERQVGDSVQSWTGNLIPHGLVRRGQQVPTFGWVSWGSIRGACYRTRQVSEYDSNCEGEGVSVTARESPLWAPLAPL